MPSRWDTPDAEQRFTGFIFGKPVPLFISLPAPHADCLWLTGPRECIGRKFATVEAVSFLTLLIRDWKIEPLLKNGETVVQWKDRVLDASMMLALGVKSAPIKFIRRKRD